MREIGVFTLVLVLLFLVLAPVMIGGAYDANQRPYTVDNESLTVDYGNVSIVEPEPEAFSYNGTAEVYNTTGDKLQNGSDFVWYPANGSVGWINTTSTSENASASVTYDYLGPTQTNYNIASLIEIVVVPLGYVIIIAGVAMSMYYAFGRGSAW